MMNGPRRLCTGIRNRDYAIFILLAVLIVFLGDYWSPASRNQAGGPCQSACQLSTTVNSSHHPINNSASIIGSHDGPDLQPVANKTSSSSLDDESGLVEEGTAPPLQPEDSPKYLIYFAESGWSNQALCLEHAFYLARIMNRTLILPPVLPHLGKGNTIARYVFGLDSGKFKTNVRPEKYYNQKLPAAKYIPMERVLDMEYSLPGVPVVDSKMFFSEMAENLSNLTQWVMETSYDHFNTKWVWNRPDLEGHREILSQLEYGQQRTLNMTYRDVLKVTNHSADLITFLDAFKTQMHESTMTPKFIPRFSPRIRQTAQSIRERWQVPYASVHLRGGDGHFQHHENIQETITTALDNITQQMTDWIRDHPDTQSLGLFVATDIANVSNHTVWKQQSAELVDYLHNTHNVQVEMLYAKSFHNETLALKEEVKYSDIFLDQQLAASAQVGFAGTAKSTFTMFIQQLRQVEDSC